MLVRMYVQQFHCGSQVVFSVVVNREEERLHPVHVREGGREAQAVGGVGEEPIPAHVH